MYFHTVSIKLMLFELTELQKEFLMRSYETNLVFLTYFS
jgi:hypothetical protein